MALSLADKKELESLIKVEIKNLDEFTNFAKQLLPSQGHLHDFTYGLVIGTIMGNYSEKFFKKYDRNLDHDELLDIYFTLSLRSPRIRKTILNKLS